jgi:hypothetical protein
MHINFVAAAVQEALTTGSGNGEIWFDQRVLTALHQGVEPAAVPPC